MIITITKTSILIICPFPRGLLLMYPISPPLLKVQYSADKDIAHCKGQFCFDSSSDSASISKVSIKGSHIGFCTGHKSPLQKQKQLRILTYSASPLAKILHDQFCFDSHVVRLTQPQRGPPQSKSCKSFFSALGFIQISKRALTPLTQCL